MPDLTEPFLMRKTHKVPGDGPAQAHRDQAAWFTRPRVVHRTRGWFAVSPPDAPLRIGVEGNSEIDVRDRFKKSAQAWIALTELPAIQRPESGEDDYVS